MAVLGDLEDLDLRLQVGELQPCVGAFDRETTVAQR